MEKYNFIENKWYSFNWDYSGKDCMVIAKIERFNHEMISISWRKYLWDNTISIRDAYKCIDISNIKELSLCDIQQYLPEDHPDKIKKELAVSDLVEDEIYHITYNKGEEFIILSAGKSEIKKYIRVHLRDFHNTGNCYGCKKIRPATPEETKWLKVCIKQDKFIKQSALDLYDDEGNIKVIEQKPSKDLILGKFNIGDIVGSLTLNFGTRTKGDILEFVLPEKWCIKVTAENKKSLEDWRPMRGIRSTGSYMLNDNFKGHANSKGYVTPYYNKNYTEITFEQFKKYVLKETVTKVDLSKQEPMKTAVHVKTSEEFDFVISKIREKSDRYNSWNVYRTESCISLDFGHYQNKDWFSKNNYKVVSFEDWCEDNEYIFVTQELKEEELKVGDYAVVLKGYRGLDFTPGNIVKLVLDEKEKSGFQCIDVRKPHSKNTNFIYTKNLRKATTQEILAETLPTVIGHIKNPFEITNAQENINILPKPKELEIVSISKYFKIRN